MCAPKKFEGAVANYVPPLLCYNSHIIADRKSRFFIWRKYHGNQKNDAQKQAKQQAV